jgi:hypothetical protein
MRGRKIGWDLGRNARCVRCCWMEEEAGGGALIIGRER